MIPIDSTIHSLNIGMYIRSSFEGIHKKNNERKKSKKKKTKKKILVLKLGLGIVALCIESKFTKVILTAIFEWCSLTWSSCDGRCFKHAQVPIVEAKFCKVEIASLT